MLKYLKCTLHKEKRKVRPKHAFLPVVPDMHDCGQHDASCKDWAAVDHGQPTYTEPHVALQQVALQPPVALQSVALQGALALPNYLQGAVAGQHTAVPAGALHLPASRPGASRESLSLHPVD